MAKSSLIKYNWHIYDRLNSLLKVGGGKANTIFNYYSYQACKVPTVECFR